MMSRLFLDSHQIGGDFFVCKIVKFKKNMLTVTQRKQKVIGYMKV